MKKRNVQMKLFQHFYQDEVHYSTSEILGMLDRIEDFNVRFKEMNLLQYCLVFMKEKKISEEVMDVLLRRTTDYGVNQSVYPTNCSILMTALYYKSSSCIPNSLIDKIIDKTPGLDERSQVGASIGRLNTNPTPLTLALSNKDIDENTLLKIINRTTDFTIIDLSGTIPLLDALRKEHLFDGNNIVFDKLLNKTPDEALCKVYRGNWTVIASVMNFSRKNLNLLINNTLDRFEDINMVYEWDQSSCFNTLKSGVIKFLAGEIDADNLYKVHKIVVKASKEPMDLSWFPGEVIEVLRVCEDAEAMRNKIVDTKEVRRVKL